MEKNKSTDNLTNALIVKMFQSIDKRLTTQGILIQSLCELLIENECILEEELDDKTKELFEEYNEMRKQTMDEDDEEEKSNPTTPYYGPVGEA